MIFLACTVPPSSLSVSISTEGTAIAGSAYYITCTVSKPAGLLANPNITWINPSGMEIAGHVNNTQIENKTVISVTAMFSPLLTSHSGLYTCRASFSSQALMVPLNISSVATVSVQSKLNKVVSISILFVLQFHHQE